AFRDYEIRAKLWLATTKVRPQVQGPLLLKNLSSTPFDDLKHLAREFLWMQSSTTGEELLQKMATKELYGEDEREKMINTLAKLTYTLRRQKNEGHKAFFARWENQIRKVNEHKVVLPSEYLGFLLINALQLSQNDIKLLMNDNQGKLTRKVVKEWTRVKESDLAWRNTEAGTIPKKANAVLHLDDDIEDGHLGTNEQEEADEDLEILLSAMEQLEDHEENSDLGGDVFDEDEVKEVLATMVRERGKGNGRNFKAVADAKKAKGLARGYGIHRDPRCRFNAKGDHGGIQAGNSYKVSIELLKKRTRCKKCNKLLAQGEDTEEALFMHYMDYLDECRDSQASSSGNRVDLSGTSEGPLMSHFVLQSILGARGLQLDEVHLFKSVNGMSSKAPFLISLPFLIYCKDYRKNSKRTENGSHEILDYQKNPKHNENESHEILDYEKNPKHNENESHEILAGDLGVEEAGQEAPMVTGPQDMGVTAEMLQTEGVHELENETVAVILHEAEVIPKPDTYESCRGFPWRTTWQRREDGTWQLLEDEIRWEELHQPERHLPHGGTLVVLFRKRIDGRPSRHVRNFPGMQAITLERMVHRAHEGLGHPELNRFLRILRLSKVSDQVLEVAKKMRCSVCEAYKLPAAARQGAPPREELFINDLVGVDTIHLRNHKGEAVPALNMIDWRSHFQLVVPMETENAKEARTAYRQWIRFFGPPKKVMLDMGSEFKAEFKKQIEADGSETIPGALEASTQRGLTERAGGVYKDILYKAVMTYTCSNLEEWKELVDTTCMTRNRLLLRAGYSPIQRVIGYTPRLPGGLLSGTDSDQGVASLRRTVIKPYGRRRLLGHGNTVSVPLNGTRQETSDVIPEGGCEEEGDGPREEHGEVEMEAEQEDQEMRADNKREAEDEIAPEGKRSRAALLEIYHMNLKSLAKQRQKKEAKVTDFHGKDATRLHKAILKEINNNLATGAYEILPLKESEQVRATRPEKVMESRYVLTKKPLEPSEVNKAASEDLLLDDRTHGPVKAKCRHVMKGFSDEAALDVESTTPQVNRDSVIFVTQAFHSGDRVNRELYCSQPREGIPGVHPKQLIRLLKTCYGLTDGPFAWYQHLSKRLLRDGYMQSRSDPCVFLLHEKTSNGENKELKGIIGVATDDLLHGGDADHWRNISAIARDYKLGKNQTMSGRFTGKDFKKEADGSITISQEFYVNEKVEQCDLAGRVSLLQQSFPEPKVMDLVECNKISEEATKHKDLGVKAGWGNAKEAVWIENSEEDVWEETPDRWIRHHRTERRTTFHPGAASGGPDLHDLLPARRAEYFSENEGVMNYEICEDEWCDQKGIRLLKESCWRGQTIFYKAAEGQGVSHGQVHSSLTQLQQLSSQGGQIIMYHDKRLAEDSQPRMVTLAAWKSFRLKRKTVDTLAAEGQALQSGIGSIHWHRLMFLEAFYGMMTTTQWRDESRRLPFMAAVDSKSLYDATNKCASTTAYISDKRTAINIAAIKADLIETSGRVRWIDTRAMLADPLTKPHPSNYLRFVMRSGRWSVVEEGTALQHKALEREGAKPHALYLMFWEFRV
ncbi:RE1, partial [Symbiodinium necroappetens]